MKPKPKQHDGDDGRVIANMNVEGMRWHDKGFRREKSSTLNNSLGEQLTQSEARQYTWYSFLAALSIVAVFSMTWVLFILFCTKIWFR